MTTTLNDMTAKKKPDPSAEEIAARELVPLAKEQGLSLTGSDGLLKQFTKSVLETALNEEMTEHLGHEKNRVPEGRESTNVRNGTRAKTVLTHATGKVELEVPRDRDGTFEPVIVRKRQRRLGEVDEVVLSLYARGLSTGEIAAHFAEIYRASVSKETVSRITDKVIEEMQAWATRPLDEVYAAIFIDAIIVKIRDGQVANRPVYAAIGVTLRGEKDVLGLWAGTGGGGGEGLDERAHRSVWPLTTVQTCIIHLIRNTFRLASRRDWDALKHDVKPIDLHRRERQRRPGRPGRADREVGHQIRRDHPAVEQRLGRVHPLLGLRRGDPHGPLLDQRDRVAERPLLTRRQSQGPLPDRAGRAEVPASRHQIPRPHRTGQPTMDHEVEASTQRVRHHLRRPLAGSRNLLIRNRRKHR